MRPLFLAGSQRSGTTALAHYLNHHPQILVCVERYKYVRPENITPELFSFERILAVDPSETNIPRNRHLKLLEQKEPDRLKWIGDKNPGYVRRLSALARNNPGARFVITHRPVEEVAESFEARASNPSDRWPRQNGFEMGIHRWNLSLRDTRAFIERSRDWRVLVVDYHRFFSDPEAVIPLLSAFLELDFDDEVRSKWAASSRQFAAERRIKVDVSPAQAALARERKDAELERWILDYIEHQGDPHAPWRGSIWKRARTGVRERMSVGFGRRDPS